MERRSTILNDGHDGELRTTAQPTPQCADVNQSDCGYCRLLKAGTEGEMKMVRLLVENGQDFECIFSHRAPYMVYKCHNRWQRSETELTQDTLKYLLSTGARTNRCLSFGHAALHHYSDQSGLRLLLEYCAIIRNNEHGESPIISAARMKENQNVEFLHEHAAKNMKQTFIRQSTRRIDDKVSVVDLRRKVDAYKLLGAAEYNWYKDKTKETWKTAISICQNADVYVKQDGNPAATCTYCKSVSGDETNSYLELTTTTDAYTAIRAVAQEMVSGKELLQRSTRNIWPKWMSRLLPCFQCPTCQSRCCIRSVVYRSVNKVKRCQYSGASYLLKWQQLNKELQSTYKSKHDSTGKVSVARMKDPFLCSQTVRLRQLTSNANEYGYVSDDGCSIVKINRTVNNVIEPIP